MLINGIEIPWWIIFSGIVATIITNYVWEKLERIVTYPKNCGMCNAAMIYMCSYIKKGPKIIYCPNCINQKHE